MTIHTPQDTAGPLIKLFCSTAFHSNVNKKKNRFIDGATVCMEFAYSPHVCVGVLPYSKDVHVRLIRESTLS